jgi:hypothetical protein
MEAICSSETLANFYQTTGRHVPHTPFIVTAKGVLNLTYSKYHSMMDIEGILCNPFAFGTHKFVVQGIEEKEIKAGGEEDDEVR